PLDDEARWLGQPDDPVSPEMLGVPSVLGRSSSRTAADPHQDATALLLDDLAGRRGQRTGGRGRRPDGAADAARTSDPSGPSDAGARTLPEPLPLGLVPAPGPARPRVPASASKHAGSGQEDRHGSGHDTGDGDDHGTDRPAETP